MTLTDLLSQPLPDLSALRGLWLVFGADLLSDFHTAQSGATTFLASPTALTDGKFALCADLLSDIGIGGVYAEAFARLNFANFGLVDVIERAEIEAVQPLVQVEI